LALSREIGDKGAMARSLNTLARVACTHVEYERGMLLFRESLTLFREMGDRLGIVRCLNGLAGATWGGELSERAARLFGAAETLRERIGAALPVSEQLELDQNVSALRASLGDGAMTPKWAEGQAMTLDLAIEYALAQETG